MGSKTISELASLTLEHQADNETCKLKSDEAGANRGIQHNTFFF